MALTFKKFAIGFAELPAEILGGLTRFLFGYTTSDKKGKKVIEHNGLLPLILNGIKAITKGLANLITNHRTAITIAFWTSLILASTVALILLWPAALTAVASFAIGGISILSLVGASTAMQIGFAAGATFIGTSLLTYLIAGLVNGLVALKNLCYPPAVVSDCDTSDDDSSSCTSSHADLMSALHRTPTQSSENTPRDEAPPHVVKEKRASAQLADAAVSDVDIEAPKL